MTQFIMVQREHLASMSARMRLLELASDDALFSQVAAKYFATTSEVRILADEGGGAEALVDDVWDAISSGESLMATELGRVLLECIDRRVAFVMWCGSDYDDIPCVTSATDLDAGFRSQAASQPAEVWLAYLPRGLRSGSDRVQDRH